MNENDYIQHKSMSDYAYSKYEQLRTFTMVIEITKRCNLNCRHCFINCPANSTEVKSKEPSTQELKRLIDEAHEMGILWCSLTGGEPLLRDDFEEIYTYLVQKGFLVTLMTNAVMMTPSVVEILKKYPPRDIEVTVYGITEETYEKVSQTKGSFQKFQQGLRALWDAGLKVRLKTMVLRSNIHEYDEIAAFCRKHTSDYYRYDGVLHMRYDADPERNAMIVSERITADELIGIELNDPDKLRSYRCSPHAIVSLSENDSDAPVKLFTCGAGKIQFIIGSEGELRLCESLVTPEFTYPLKEKNIRDGLPILQNKIDNYYSNREEFKKNCGHCEVINLCLWCPGNAYIETGCLDKKVPYFCEIGKKKRALLDLD